MKKIFILLLIIISIIPAKTRRATTRFTPNADMIGAGRVIVNYHNFMNSEYGEGISGRSLYSISIGASEWVEGNLAYADGVGFSLKGRILDEYVPASPSLAIGIQNFFRNTTLYRSRLDAKQYKETGEVYAALAKSSEVIQTRLHAGLLSLPGSEIDKINGFFAIEKYFGDDFFITFEGFSQQKKFYMALTLTLRFLPRNMAEIYFSLLDLESAFSNDRRGFGISSLIPNSRNDWIKPGIIAGMSLTFGGKQKWIDGRTQFKTVEDNFAHHDTIIKKLIFQVGDLKSENECLNMENEFIKTQIDSLKIAFGLIDTMPMHYSEIYSRIVSYAAAYSADNFNPLEVRRIVGEVRKYGKDGENIVAYIAYNSSDRTIKIRSVTMLGELRAWDKVPLLLEMLENTVDSRLKVEIITALGKINDRSVRAKIEEYAASADDYLSIAANEVLDFWRRADTNSQEIIPLNTNNNVFSIEPR